MKANELRVGNFVKYENKVFEIAGTSPEYPFLNTIEFGVGVVEWHTIKSIPLTDEWFIKFGATKDKDYNVHNTLSINDDYGYILFVHTEKGYDVFIHINDHSVLLYNEIQYVHQLQNLYYAITGEELKICN